MTTANSDEERMLQELLPPLEISETFVEEEDTFAKQKSQRNESGESSFLDFSLKSPFEKLVSSIEYAVNDWLFASKFEALFGDESLTRPSEFGGTHHASVSKAIEHKLHFRRDSYQISFHFDTRKKTLSLRDAPRSDDNTSSRNLQRWFKCDTFFVIEPMSYSKRFIDNDEAATVRSAAAVAMSNLSVYLPVFTPIDRSSNRNSVIGVSFSTESGASYLYESDSMVGFTSENAFCALSSEETSKAVFSIARKILKKDVAVARTTVCYRISMDGSSCSIGKTSSGLLEEVLDEDDIEPDIVVKEASTSSSSSSPSWDDEQIWSQWVCLPDPFDSIEIDCFFERNVELHNCVSDGDLVEDSLDNANMYTIRSIPNGGGLVGGIAALSGAPPADISQMSRNRPQHSFSLAELLHISSSEIFLDRGENFDLYSLASANEIASDEWWIDRLGTHPPHAPPEAVMEDILLDLFQDFIGECHGIDAIASIPKTARGHQSLISRVSLHAMKLKNSRAIAELWNKFTKELRYKHWERGVPLPRMSKHGSKEIEVDHSACILDQQLQLLNACIHRRLRQSEGATRTKKESDSKDVVKRNLLKLKKKEKPGVLNESKRNASACVWKADDDLDLNALLNDDMALAAANASASQKTEEMFEDARDDVMLAEPSSNEDEGFGVKSALEMRLLEHPHVFIREPEMQLHPIYTEESLHALIEDGDDEGERDTKRRNARLAVSNDMLVSDMCAFKAANPTAAFVDFVRWHSPRDFLEGKLSERMSKPGNTWETLFKEAEPTAACDQKLLFDPIAEGERVLHLLETAKFDTILRYLCAIGANAAFCIYAKSCMNNLGCAESIHPLLEEKMQRCRGVCASVFYDVKQAQKEDFAQAAYEIQLIERTASRAASLRKHVGEKSELNFVIERLWIDSVQREYESQANEEDVDAAFNAVDGVCALSKDEERHVVLENIAAKQKLACEYEIEEKTKGVSRLHVSASARFVRVSSIS